MTVFHSEVELEIWFFLNNGFMTWPVLIKYAYIFPQTYNVKKGPLATTPTFGLPSKDTHFLRDDEVSVDKPLETVFVDSPAKVRMTVNGG